MTYEYKCSCCGTLFEIKATIARKTRGLRLECPKCGSAKGTQVFTSMNVFARSSDGRVRRQLCQPVPGSKTGCC